MEPKMNQIQIPVDHFFRAASRSYGDWLKAVIREFHQNCTDAGATRIDYNFDPDTLTLTVSDNGCGCTASDITDKLLTLGGTGKVAGATSTGGFGIAKEILYFPWSVWTIRTRNVLVEGVGSQYRDPATTDQEFAGFEAVITFPDLVTLQKMQYRAQSYLPLCEREGVETFVNGIKIVTTLLKGRMARQFGWADIYVSADPEHLDYEAHVRVNGVHMFSHYIGDNCPQVIVEITRPSTEVLISNRDGFRTGAVETGKFQEEFQKFVQELIIDKKQAVREIDQEHTELIRGDGVIKVEDPYLKAVSPKEAAKTVAGPAGVRMVEAFQQAGETAENIYCSYDVRKCLETFREDLGSAQRTMANTFNDAETREEKEDAKVMKTWVDNQAEIAEMFIEKAEEKIKAGERYEAADILKLVGRFPDVIVRWKGADKKAVQKVLGLKSTRIVLRVWADFLKLIMLHAGNYDAFRVGLGIGLDGVEALYFREKDGIHNFLINPTINEDGEADKKFKISSKYAVDEILDRAIHEIAHVRESRHDIDFSQEIDRIRRALRPHMGKFQSMFNTIKATAPKVSEREEN